MLDDRLDHPALITGKRPAFHDLDLVADLAAQLIVRLDALAQMDNLAVERMPECPADLDHDSFGHLVTGDNTSDSTTVIHASPSCTAVC